MLPNRCRSAAVANPSLKRAKLFRATLVATAGCLLPGVASLLYAQQDTLSTIRSDVRQGPPPSQASPPQANSSQSAGSSAVSDAVGDVLDQLDAWEIGFYVVGGAATAPFWAPHLLLNDDFVMTEYFPPFPYDRTPGYIVDSDS